MKNKPGEIFGHWLIEGIIAKNKGQYFSKPSLCCFGSTFYISKPLLECNATSPFGDSPLFSLLTKCKKLCAAKKELIF